MLSHLVYLRLQANDLVCTDPNAGVAAQEQLVDKRSL
jgi:hypothetical protein